MGLFLTSKDIAELKQDHRAEEKRRYADRIKSVLLLDEGMKASEVARILLLDEKSVRRYRELYEEGGLEGLCIDEIVGKRSRLSLEQEDQLIKELKSKIYLSTAGIIKYVQLNFCIEYSVSGMAKLLERLGFSYKKPKVVPGKANKELQEQFLQMLGEIAAEDEQNPLFYLDGVHPQHNSHPAYGWFVRGEETQLKTNTGRERVNITGALNARTHEIVIQEDERFNADTTINFFKRLEAKNPVATVIRVVLDNAGYYKGQKIREYLASSRIELLYLPPYSPNLNLIERAWKFFKKKALANQYYEKYSEFRKACLSFFEKDNWDKYKLELRTLLTNNFEIIQA